MDFSENLIREVNNALRINNEREIDHLLSDFLKKRDERFKHRRVQEKGFHSNNFSGNRNNVILFDFSVRLGGVEL